MKLITATLTRPVVEEPLRTKFFENHISTQFYFNWLIQNGVDHSFTVHIDEAKKVETAYLIVILEESQQEMHDGLWEMLVDVNMSHWFNTETFCTVGHQDVVGQAKSAT